MDVCSLRRCLTPGWCAQNIKLKWVPGMRPCQGPCSQWGPWVGQWSWYSQGLCWSLWSVLPPKHMWTPVDPAHNADPGRCYGLWSWRADAPRKLTSHLPCLWNRWHRIKRREELVLPFSIPQHWGQGCGCRRAISHRHRALLSWWFLALMQAERLGVLRGLTTRNLAKLQWIYGQRKMDFSGEGTRRGGCPWKDWEMSMIGSIDGFQVVLKIILLKLSGQWCLLTKYTNKLVYSTKWRLIKEDTVLQPLPYTDTYLWDR